MRRLEIFHTTSLLEKDPDAPQWLEKNAFGILLWIVKEIRQNYRLVDRHDRFFEREVGDFVPVKVC